VIRPPHRALTAASVALTAVTLLLASFGHSASPAGGIPLAWSWWTLPENFSVHGTGIDKLYYFIFWLTTVTFFFVQIVLVIFLIQYRYKPETKKARFIHGNSRLELIWTIIPAIIMLSLALASKSVWDNYRYSPDLDNPNAAHILIIARQFNWNAIYAGPDGKLGQYLVFPKPTDIAWPVDSKGNAVKFAGVPGPAFLKYADAMDAINKYTARGNTASDNNEFGKVFDPKNPDGSPNPGNDDIINNPAGLLELPVNRPTVLDITSMDVIHDFYLPNFRVNVYAVPGQRVSVALTPTKTSKEMEAASKKLYNVDDLPSLIASPATKDLVLDIADSDSPGDATNKDLNRGTYRYFVTKGTTKTTIIRDQKGISADNVDAITAQLKAAGLTQIKAHLPYYWEIVCAQLCGNLHTTMEGKIYVLDQAEWSAKYEGKTAAAATPAATDTAVTVNAAN
jgi:heme/copper-type cytochrome/quinol oxidase subunit 2